MNQQTKPIPNRSNESGQSVLAKIQALAPRSSSLYKNWILQVSQNAVEVWKKDFLNEVDPLAKVTHCGRDFYELSTTAGVTSKQLLDTALTRWICPIEHRWPTQPNSTGFVERAAAGLLKKFGSTAESIVVVSPTPELRKVASNVKARLKQITSDHLQSTQVKIVEGSVLNVIVHKSGILAGSSPSKIETGSAYDAGLAFLTDRTEQVAVSRAAGKISEILTLLKHVNIDCNDLRDWLELGAAPGGMTQTLLQAGASVTAVDLADMKPELLKHPKIKHLRTHADAISSASPYSALLCDMNGPAELAVSHVSRLIKTMSSGAVIVHTLKVEDFMNLKKNLVLAQTAFRASGANIISIRHLFHNRKELTIIAVRS